MPLTARCRLPFAVFVAAFTVLATAVPALAQSRRSCHRTIRSPRPATPSESQLAIEWDRAAQRFDVLDLEVVTDIDPARARALAEHLLSMQPAYAELLGNLRQQRSRDFELWLFTDEADYHRVVDREFDADVRGSKAVSLEYEDRVAVVAVAGPTPRATSSVAAGAAGTAAGDRASTATGATIQSRDAHGWYAADEPIRRLLRAEGYLQVQSTIFNDVPAWLAHGMAEQFADAVSTQEQIILGEIAPDRLRRITALSQGRRLRPFATFMHDPTADWSEPVWVGTNHPHADQAWAMVHHLLWSNGGRNRASLQNLFRNLARGGSGEAAWRDAFGAGSEGAWQQQFVAYLGEIRPTDFQTTLDRLAFLTAGSKHLAAQDAGPATTLDDLRARLEAESFTFELTDGARVVTLDATDPSVYTVAVPGTATGTAAGGSGPAPTTPQRGTTSVGPAPVFTLVPCPNARGRAAARLPQCIATEGLFPRTFGVGWTMRRGQPVPELLIR